MSRLRCAGSCVWCVRHDAFGREGLSGQPVDFRKGPDSLLSLVRDGGQDPFNGVLYVFRAKRADRVKIVWWDGSGPQLSRQPL